MQLVPVDALRDMIMKRQWGMFSLDKSVNFSSDCHSNMCCIGHDALTKQTTFFSAVDGQSEAHTRNDQDLKYLT
eukprot:scaffold253291_cov20-Prasinocladus_malaysianus.AAC.1